VLTNSSNGYITGYSPWLYYNWSSNAGYYPVTADYTHASDSTWDFHDMTTLISERLDYATCSYDATRVLTPSDGCVINAAGYIVQPDNYTFTFNVPDTFLKFPLHAGDHFGGSYHATAPITSGSSYRTVYGSRTTTVDMHGRLILPHGSYSDVLLLKIVDDYTDSLHNSIDTVYKRHDVRYKWYSPTQREYLLTVDSNRSMNGFFGESSYNTRVMSGFVLPWPMAVKDPSGFDDVRIYPNPATASLNISAPDKITSITISNVLGQAVYTHQYNSPQVQVNVADLPTGVYFIRVNDSVVRRFVKE